MIKEPGVFSQRYLMRKGKENTNHINTLHHLPPEHDFPLAYTSAKTLSRERNSVSANRKREEKRNEQRNTQELEEKMELIAKLQKQLKECRGQTRRLAKEAQTKYTQYDKHIAELNEEIRQKDEMLAKASFSLKTEMKGMREGQDNAGRFKEVIKGHIYWMLNFFKMLNEESQIENIKKEVSHAFMGFKDYITEFAIEKELQVLANNAHPTLSSCTSTYNDPRKNTDSIFTEDLEDINMIKIMELQPLIETFNNQQYCAAPQEEAEEVECKAERITRRLFQDSQFAGESNSYSLIEEDKRHLANCSEISQNEFLSLPTSINVPVPQEREIQLPLYVPVIKDFDPDSSHENYIKLQKGETLKLLRKIRDMVWIGEVRENIGIVSQECFQLA